MVGKVGLERQVCEGDQQAVLLLLHFVQLLFLQVNLREKLRRMDGKIKKIKIKIMQNSKRQQKICWEKKKEKNKCEKREDQRRKSWSVMQL